MITIPGVNGEVQVEMHISTTGNSTSVTFANKYGLDKSDYYTTTGRDLGVDLSNEYPFLQAPDTMTF